MMLCSLLIHKGKKVNNLIFKRRPHLNFHFFIRLMRKVDQALSLNKTHIKMHFLVNYMSVKGDNAFSKHQKRDIFFHLYRQLETMSIPRKRAIKNVKLCVAYICKSLLFSRNGYLIYLVNLPIPFNYLKSSLISPILSFRIFHWLGVQIEIS